MLTERLTKAEANATAAGVTLVDDPFLFACDVLGDDPWDPDTVTQFFARLRVRLDLEHLEFKGLRRFMDTYGQELGFSLAQVSMRAGHDPAVAAKHYTGRVLSSDRQLADAIGALVDGASGQTTADRNDVSKFSRSFPAPIRLSAE